MPKKRFFSFIISFFYAISFSANALSIASWNLQWLTSQPIHHSKLKINKRSSSDFEQLATLFRQNDVDILAFQEVNDSPAIKKVVGNEYKLYLSDRSKPEWSRLQFKDINQYTGFAVRKSLFITDPPDIQLIHKSQLRFASYIVLRRTQKPDLHLLSVHLKSGCFGKWNPHKKACITLKKQGVELNKWMKQRIINHNDFAILGDFNHNLSYPKDWLWRGITHNLNHQPILSTKRTSADCRQLNKRGKTFRYRHIIDHMITSDSVTISETHQVPYPAKALKHYQLSDHCLLLGRLK
ncbi:endonuclease/exonuclease/phosphatase family protein [Vibrio salinus]|uniref:endonuclease/exonuclease/phosphatase family protein n=1 Tax=Vibrio salinus TaxID=2899784 RepID=UPI001E5D259E|nr:endonuclease/exonuclease/phosphatase family protein [Vibrio salinus]MCE0495392.1 endonuclease/exonuclease/phosphatase family protein [Vibrio salinus]